MFDRASVRYACYRRQKGIQAESHQEILQEVEKTMLPTDRWEDFSKKWDVFVNKKTGIKRIVPETNFDYVHTTCTEFKVMSKMGLSLEEIQEKLDERQQNVFEIVMLNNIEDDFTGYGETWNVTIDKGSSRLEVKSLKTKLNKIPAPKPTPIAAAVNKETVINMDDAEKIEDKELIKKLKALLTQEGVKL